MNKLLKLKLREHALVLRRLSASLRTSVSKEVLVKLARAKKEELMREIWSIMTATLGVPPRPDAQFTWDYYDKDGNVRTVGAEAVQEGIHKTASDEGWVKAEWCVFICPFLV